jgi:hypothetical protein
MADKAGFLTAMGATNVIGGTKAFSAPNATTNAVTCTAHGKISGYGPVRLTTSDTLPAGLSTGTDYWLINVDANTVKFATSAANALAGTAVDFTDVGAGTFAMQATVQTLADMLSGVVANHLTFPGNKDQTPAVNVDRFWRDATFAPFPAA